MYCGSLPDSRCCARQTQARALATADSSGAMKQGTQSSDCLRRFGLYFGKALLLSMSALTACSFVSGVLGRSLAGPERRVVGGDFFGAWFGVGSGEFRFDIAVSRQFEHLLGSG
jgi:hypothetical protein